MNYRYDKVYVDDVEFPYTPVHDEDLNDVDLDAYTNTKGYTIRNRVREDVVSLNFSIPTLVGKEMHKILQLRSPVWFNVTFFNEDDWKIVTKKMYCSPVKYHKEYIDPYDPNKNIYTDISFSFVEQ